MCGIFGVVLGKEVSVSPTKLRSWVDKLFLLSESRGKEASGLAMLVQDRLVIYKHPVSASKLIRLSHYSTLFSPIPSVVIGHSRLATNGLQSDNVNNQPVVSGSIVIIHNGIVVNDEELTKKYPEMPRNARVDTEVLGGMVDRFYRKGVTFSAVVRRVFAEMEGSASVAVLCDRTKSLVLATNTGSLYVATYGDPEVTVFASERNILEGFTQSQGLSNSLRGSILQVRPVGAVGIRKIRIPSSGGRFVVEDKSYLDADLGGSPYVLFPGNQIKDLEKHHPPYRAINDIRRCQKCILPETMPFITFDAEGVCNYCRYHKPVFYKGKELLEELVAPFRKNSEPDCIVALSGGRDSSYGLHYVKNVLKMNPIAYTYDWGMITDIARRNQARMVGKLGVEHVLVSANIQQKREHIRKHILAWLKRPSLGMIPLFTAGDKQAEYYVEELKRKTGIKLVIYCRGNELEDEKFKFGHVGILDGTPGAVIHSLSALGKIKILAYYAKEYLLNPSYFDSSIADTLFAYAATYGLKHDFVYLWHYIAWDEKKIIDTLVDGYGWEKANDTIATWRIDDGTPCLYNYIYYTVQGFTEHDALRSNQIREGQMGRAEALSKVREENKPRYESLKWYFDALNLNGELVLRGVDNMPKLYKT